MPLEVLPRPVELVAKWSPFAHQAYYPAQVYLELSGPAPILGRYCVGSSAYCDCAAGYGLCAQATGGAGGMKLTWARLGQAARVYRTLVSASLRGTDAVQARLSGKHPHSGR